MAAPPGSNGAKELVVASAVAFALSLVLTWPLAARFGTAGRVDSGDGRFSIWNVAWVAHALTTDPQSLWDANIFYPSTDALSFSEPNIVAGLIAAPVWALTHNAYAASNWAILWAFTLAAVAMFALVKHLTGNRWGAGIAGLLFAFCSYAFAHLAHMQLLMTFGLPLALLAMHRFVESPAPRSAAALGLAVATAALSCGYYGIFGGLAVGLGVVWFSAWEGRYRSTRYWLLAALAGGFALLLVLPFLRPYLDIQRDGFARTLQDARVFRAGWRSYLASALLAYQWMLPLLGSWREVLFPGFLSIGLAAFAAIRVLRHPSLVPHLARRRTVIFYLVLGVLAAWASLGPDAGLYRLMFETLPFMTLLRAPARAGVLVTLSMAVLAGIGVAVLERGWTGRYRRVWLTALVIAALARSTVGPLEWTVAAETPSAVKWLSRLPRGPVAEFPFFGSNGDMFQQTQYMLASTEHWQPLINGYSDVVPAHVAETLEPLAAFPAADALRVLQQRHTRYVVIHWNKYSLDDRVRLRREVDALHESLTLLVGDRDASLYEMSASAVAHPQ